jgi:1-acyl-sn-glycerol-3-phosphate acyltransferase
MKLLRYIYTIYALTIFILLMFIALPFVFASLLFGKVKGGNLIYKVCKTWAAIWYLFIGIKHKSIIEEAIDPTKQYIFVANHISYIDIPTTILALNQPYRVLGKHDMVKYPVFGWIYKAAVILVNRDDIKHRTQSVRELNAALSKGISIFIFPEGTFNETKKPLKHFYDGAFRLAIQTHTPIKPLLFLDNNQRLHYNSIFSLNPGISRVVYLPAIPTEGYTSKDVAVLKEKVYRAMEEGLLRYEL